MAQRARLDHDQVYWGPEEVAELGPEDIAAPDQAIKPGRYRWQPAKDGEVGHWVPLPPTQVKSTQAAPTLEQVIAETLRLLPERGPLAKAWLKWFDASVDGSIK